MAEIPEGILSNLKCSECKEHLSCPPVFLRENAESICGKCQISNSVKRNNLHRNHMYEGIAKFLLFPCKYEKRGCNMKFKWGESQDHEKICKHSKFKLLSCPALLIEKCIWQGTYIDIFQHFKKEHPDLIAEYPYKMNPYTDWIVNDMKKLLLVSYRNMLMNAHGFLFLVQFKVCFQTDTMWLGVSLIGDPKLAVHFEFLVELYASGLHFNGNHVFISQVAPSITFDENSSIKLNLHQKLLVDIIRNRIKCANCHKEFSKLTNYASEYCCNDWIFFRNEKTELKRSAHRCLFHDRGCSYIDNPKNVAKHQDFFCLYSMTSICPNCDFIAGKSNMPLIEHFKSNHYKTRYFNDIFIPSASMQLFDNDCGLMETQNGSFMCAWAFLMKQNKTESLFLEYVTNEYFFSIKVLFTDLPFNQDEKLKFQITFINSVTNTAVKSHLIKRTIVLEKNVEWCIELEIDPKSLRSETLFFSLRIELDESM